MKKIYLNILILFACINSIIAQHAGSLDPEFNKTGFTSINNIEGAFYDITTLTDGKIIASGYILDGAMLMRFKNDGTVDSSFANNGMRNITNDIPPLIYVDSRYVARQVFTQPGNKLLVCALRESGFTSPNIVLLRYDLNGSLDLSYGDSGVIVTDFSSNFISVTLQSDNKLLLQGDYTVERLQVNGRRDSSFGKNGVVDVHSLLTPKLSFYQNTFASIDSNNRIIVLGYGGNTTSDYDIFITRFLSNGNLDSSFGKNGITRKGSPDFKEQTGDMCILPDNTIVADASMTQGSTEKSEELVKFLENGHVDNSFNNSGSFVIPLSSFNDGSFENLFKIVSEPDGKILFLIKNHLKDDDRSLFMLRLNQNGTIDSSFGIGGISLLNYTRKLVLPYCLKLGNDGKAYVGGALIINHTSHPIITRVLLDDVSKNYIKQNTATSVQANKHNLSVYPVPAKDILYIKGLNGKIPIRISITNNEGSVVMAGASISDNINISSLKRGVYFINISGKNMQPITLKFLKQ